MPGHDIIVIGASAGGVETLLRIVRELPAEMPAALFVVLHVAEETPSVLPDILTRAGSLKAAHFPDGAPIQHGHIYVAPPGQHLLVQRGRIELWHGPRIHGHRPAIDATFRSAARAYGPQVVSVVLTGSLSDGAAGTVAVKARGGIAVVQDPYEAPFPSMPENTIARAPVDYVLPLAEIPALLVRLANEEAKPGGAAMPEDFDEQDPLVAHDLLAQESGARANQPSVVTCPDCGGVLWEMTNGQLIEYRCHVGHVYGIDSLKAQQAEAVESALWAAIRSLTEQAVLAQRLATRATSEQHDRAAEHFADEARQAASAAAVLRQVVEERNGRGNPVELQS